MAGCNASNQNGLSRQERQKQLADVVLRDPFMTDEELADRFGVSVQTIRLDRLALGIPEVRKRLRTVARQALGRVRSVGSREIVGDIVDLELGKKGLSILEAASDMAFERTGLVRSQHIFAQADSLALAVIDSPRAVTTLANAKFKSAVPVGARLIAKAEVLRSRPGSEYVVLVQTRADDRLVFRGKFVVQGLDEKDDGEEDSS